MKKPGFLVRGFSYPQIPRVLNFQGRVWNSARHTRILLCLYFKSGFYICKKDSLVICECRLWLALLYTTFEDDNKLCKRMAYEQTKTTRSFKHNIQYTYWCILILITYKLFGLAELPPHSL
jgi:hypothetical protein